MVLSPPVEPMLAQARETLPPLAPGRMAAQPKFDGFRALLYTPLHAGDPVLLQSRRGALVQDRFPDLTAAARSIPNGLVLDGELAVLDRHGQFSFTALQRRATAGRNARVLAAEMPAHFIVFDVLQSGARSWWTSRSRAAARSWRRCSPRTSGSRRGRSARHHGPRGGGGVAV
ncbi:hypothetical protein PV405_26755 [Streptomyces sp. ME02-6979-3A]|uniref:ATP-dependent DNA ligase family profile domain-containing protein n=1 Tax=Streptomyces silvae TaxID=2803812 RepID=A0ABU7ZUG6_9ACTN|nr:MULTISPECIES: hypothetical protein [unclassified Streptomyces]MDX3328216.1 hypothetical protein [Streptomyces sp. ME02-6979-3A]MDX3433608.1 hypothetical protein [Streptomyces sp. ME01-18a]MDX3688597.1 hypothetical protein [Streptomyces sp. AK04-4c]